MSEWQRIYHPKFGKYVYKHKGTGVVTDSLFKIGKVLKKPLIALAKKAGKQVAEKGIAKASDVVVKKAGDKIGNVLRRKATKRSGVKKGSVANKPSTASVAASVAASKPTTHRQDMLKLNNLLAQL